MSVQRHDCPAKCGRTIDNRLFCCAEDWFKLSRAARAAIGRTAELNPLAAERREAIRVAMLEWRMANGPRKARR